MNNGFRRTCNQRTYMFNAVGANAPSSQLRKYCVHDGWDRYQTGGRFTWMPHEIAMAMSIFSSRLRYLGLHA